MDSSMLMYEVTSFIDTVYNYNNVVYNNPMKLGVNSFNLKTKLNQVGLIWILKPHDAQYWFLTSNRANTVNNG